MADIGTLISHAYTSNAVIPVPGVTVAYTQKDEHGADQLVAVRITGSDGLTSPVEFSTPQLSESLSPGTAQPFAVVNIYAEHPLFDSILAEGVQIFSGTTTVQNLELLPRRRDPSMQNETEEFNTPPQNL